ncbi:hypothetical protein AB1283_00730 [Bacillus sp. S13(2024)]|uniref:hypothetical protein n=1 Tax=Bacillus sp. S13(2024) TaxID=3162885 RepID=UPI003D1B9ED1
MQVVESNVVSFFGNIHENNFQNNAIGDNNTNTKVFDFSLKIKQKARTEYENRLYKVYSDMIAAFTPEQRQQAAELFLEGEEAIRDFLNHTILDQKFKELLHTL